MPSQQGNRRYQTQPPVGCCPGASVWVYATELNPSYSPLSLHCVASCFWPLCANVTSSIKPELHNISQRLQRKTEPQPYVTRTKIGVDRTCISGDMLADRQRDMVTAILPYQARSNYLLYLMYQLTHQRPVCQLHTATADLIIGYRISAAVQTAINISVILWHLLYKNVPTKICITRYIHRFTKSAHCKN